MICGHQNEKEAKKLLGAKIPRKDEEMAWPPPINMSEWPDWERGEKDGRKRVEAKA